MTKTERNVQHRVHNFNAGPAALPLPVLEQVRDELLDYQHSGMSILEMSHRGKEVGAMAEAAEQTLRRLLGIGQEYKVLFLAGGAQGQFAAIPMNLMGSHGGADYIETGSWSAKAMTEAKRYGHVHVAASSRTERFCILPPRDGWKLRPDAAYVHYTINETIEGVEFQDIPETAGVPLVADVSSTILSRPLAVDRFGLLYAGAQKNMGPAGLAVVIVHEELLGRAAAITPGIWNYALQAADGSMLNTPPVFAWYIAGLVFQWLEAQGGLEAMARRNQEKKDLLYATLDESDFYHNPVHPSCRSWMNVPFLLADTTLEKPFLQQAEAAGLVGLKGHRSVGGMRASLYNAVPLESVRVLVDFLKDFRDRHG